MIQQLKKELAEKRLDARLKHFSKCSKIVVYPTIANAILDRLLHHSHIISIKGLSYRLKSKLNYLDSSSYNNS